jgi:tripartite-type tricarboxylate transporter receptor subunit TctC
MGPRTGRLRPPKGLEPLGILQTYATPEQQAAEIREEFRRVGDMVKKAGLTK